VPTAGSLEQHVHPHDTVNCLDCRIANRGAVHDTKVEARPNARILRTSRCIRNISEQAGCSRNALTNAAFASGISEQFESAVAPAMRVACPAKKPPLNVLTFLARARAGLSVKHHATGAAIFSQADPADALFYIRKGKVKLSVVSTRGKLAVIAILEAGAFFGEGCLAGQLVRVSTAIATVDCALVRLERPRLSPSSARNQPSRNYSCITCWPAISVLRKIWSIGSSTPARSD